ncbi:MAG: TIGR01777 family oxidoreductase [Microbacteriaceae bacterium]
MRILIAGASGFIGTALTARLRAAGDEVRVLVRRAPSAAHEVPWTPGQRLNPAELDGVDAVVNLAGASISQLPWTAKRKTAILQSRLDATHTLTTALRANPGAALINASAVGLYGDRGDETLTEAVGPDAGFLAGVVEQWEAAALEVAEATRVVTFRTGLVIGNGGAIVPLRAMMTAGMGGNLGSGRQWWPWISLTDEVAAIEFLLRSKLAGAVNLAGPTPATMGEIGRTLSRVMHRPYYLHAPAFALKLALGEAADELLLASQRVVPQRLLDAGFAFEHPTAEAALRALFRA